MEFDSSPTAESWHNGLLFRARFPLTKPDTKPGAWKA